MLYENIAAISTPLGVGGVAIIRISGKNPLSVVRKMFKSVSGIKPSEFEPYKMYPGEIDAGTFKDFGLCVYFKAPKSYTGENMVEFHCHGGVAITEGILKRILSFGVRIAENGEFTRRAFLNGKMSLSSAEGLIGMINSETESGAKAGYYLYRENLKKEVEREQEILTEVLAELDANIDFPEDDVPEYELKGIKDKLIKVKSAVEKLINTYDKGRILKNGVKVSIVGRPNVGKSSVLNRLLNYDKAIVSSVAGTTRDIVEGSISIGGIKFDFSDTAGIRESDDEIENAGIDKANRALDDSDIVLFVLDSSEPLTAGDRKIFEKIKDKTKIVVYNKIDVKEKVLTDGVDLLVSAKTGEGFNELKTLLKEKCLGKKINLNGDFITEERHFKALKDADEKLISAIKGIGELPLDLLSIDVKSAWETLGEITGKTASEEIINEIFSKFCVGK